MAFCDKLKEIRIKKEISQYELAEKLHITQSAVAHWERGVGLPDLGILIELSKIFLTPIEEFFSMEELKDIVVDYREEKFNRLKNGEENNELLRMEGIVKTYEPKDGIRVEALKGLDLSLPKTGMIFFVGKSGSGKTTLFNLLGGLDTPTDGKILYNGKDISAYTRKEWDTYRLDEVGIIFQEYNLLTEFNVFDNISLALELQGKDTGEIETILKKVELERFAKQRVNRLSGGQKQRVAIARALVKNPKMVLADEPTGALDEQTGEEIFKLLRSISKERLVLVVTHDREAALIFGDRLIEISDGKIITDRNKVRKD